MFSRFYNTPTFVSVLAVFQAGSVAGWSFPFGSAAGASCFVFVAPYFQVAPANMAFDVSWFGLE